jgi:hypothetical protein
VAIKLKKGRNGNRVEMKKKYSYASIFNNAIIPYKEKLNPITPN